MHKSKKTSIFLLIYLCFVSCTASNKKYYSYTSVTSSVESIKKRKYFAHLVSYGNYLVEFNIKVYMEETYHAGDSIPTQKIKGFDTLSVYLLSGKNYLFYEFDTFALKTHVVKVGKWDDKPMGQGLSSDAHRSDTQLLYGPLQKELINNIPCFVTRITMANAKMNDSLFWEGILVKNAQLNSFPKITGDLIYPDKNYSFVGFRAFDKRRGGGIITDIENLRPLNEKEISICKNMVELMKTCVTDTIGNYKK